MKGRGKNKGERLMKHEDNPKKWASGSMKAK